MAKQAEWGICLARSAPDRPKHEGISCLMVDMKTPGIDIRPLREMTGQEMFNEVFFDDVFVPEDCLVGQEHDGWRAARTTLANERVYMGGSNTIGGGVVGALKAIEARGLADDRCSARSAASRSPTAAVLGSHDAARLRGGSVGVGGRGAQLACSRTSVQEASRSWDPPPPPTASGRWSAAFSSTGASRSRAAPATCSAT